MNQGTGMGQGDSRSWLERHKHDLTTAEVRRAIAISFVSVFFGLLAFGDAIEIGDNALKATLENFWWIIIAIIGFYFGGRSAEKVAEKRAEKLASNGEHQEGTG